MHNDIEHQIRAARPSLKEVSPVSYWFVVMMGTFNLIIGMAFILTLRTTHDPTILIVNKFVPFFAWGIMFFSLGVLKLWSIIVNNWKWARYSLLIGVGLKSVWAIALTIKSFSQPDNIFLNLTWVALALTQIICYIYFMPPYIQTNKQKILQ